MMPDGYMWHKNDVTFQGNRGRSYRSRCTFVRYGLYICQQILSLAGSPPQESLGRATYVLMRSVKTNKELLLERVTEPRRYAPGTRLGGHSEKEWF